MRRADAEKLYYALQVLLFMPTWVVMAVYLVRELHLSPLELVLMGTAMEGAVLLAEVPTGATPVSGECAVATPTLCPSRRSSIATSVPCAPS